ncbi:MAG TPA: PEP-utilizing enzyme [Anaerolineales bacterium]|nr:PEP-utilizing enzyme [Anaerolineales bacterium]
MPITVQQSGYNPETGAYNDSLTGDYLWSSVNTREATPDVMTPYTWSAMRLGFAQMTMLPGYLPVGNICGRIYNNASVGATAFKALGQRNSFDASSRELYGIDPNDVGAWNVPLISIGFRDRALVLRNALQIMGKVRSALKSVHIFVDTNPGWCEKQHRSLSGFGRAELLRWSDEILLPYLIKCFWWMVSSAITQANLVSKLRRDLLKIASSSDTIALLSNVSSEEEFLSSLGIVAGIDRLRRGQMSREEYLKQYGHRGPHEVEMYIPRPAENPNWIDEQMAGLESAPADVDSLLRDQRARYEAALKNLQKNAPRKFDSLRQRLQEAARLTRLREAGRAEVIRTFWVSRLFVLGAGASCGLDEQAFFLEHDELIRLLRGQDESRDQITARKTAYHRFTALPQYPTLIMGHFDPFTWAADPHRRTDIYDATRRINQQFTHQVKGLPGSAGQAIGRVRILNSPEESDQFQPGEILVAITTNVGWTPIFPRAAAVVTDVGAPLSHAAIVARELGIPAVVGCFNATSLLKTGDRVRVDGGQGTVEVLEGTS